MSFQAVLTPNGVVHAKTQLAIVVSTVGFFFAVWLLMPTSTLMPSPAEVWGAYPNLLDQGLIPQLLMSWTTNVEAILLSCVITIPLSYLTVVPIIRPLAAGISKMRFLGMTGLVVAFTLLFGGGHALKLALLVFGMGVFLVTSLCSIVENIPKEEFDHARTLRMGPWASVMEVVILGHSDAVLDTVIQNAAMGWVMLSMVEGLVRFEGGLGAMMLAEDKHINLAAVAALQIVVMAVGIGQDAVLFQFKKWFCPYAFISLERK